MIDHTNTLAVLAATLIGENSAGGYRGMQSVANVIVNRADNPRWWGSTIRSVCLKPYQFSCWLPGPDLDRMEAMASTDPVMIMATDIARLAIAGTLPDLTENADSYFDPGGVPDIPALALRGTYTVTIAGQRFYRTELPAPSTLTA